MLSDNATIAPAISLLEWPISWFIPKRYRLDSPASQGHLAFASDLVKSLNPALIVELGTQSGESYFAFCQSVADNHLGCACYAVNRWREEIYRELAAYNDANYSSFSYLLPKSFDEGAASFSNGSIDLLNIAGGRTYEAVKRDFETWVSKVKPGGVILLENIMARDGESGVWRLWDELKREFNETFEFHHDRGLGVLRKPGGDGAHQSLLDVLFHSTADHAESIRRYYVVYSSHLQTALQSRACNEASGAVQSGLYVNRNGTYAENEAIWQNVQPGERRQLRFILPGGTGDGPLHFYPANIPCRVELGEIRIVASDSEEILWHAAGFGDGGIEIGGTLVELRTSSQPVLISTGARPLIKLSIPRTTRLVQVCVTLRISVDFFETYQIFQTVIADCFKELQVSQNEHVITQAEIARALLKVDQLEDKLLRLSTRSAAQERELTTLRDIRDRTSELEQALRQRDETLTGILQSLSWKLTSPIRKVSEAVRRAR